MKKLLPMALGMMLLAGCAGESAATAPTETTTAVMEETTTTTTTTVTTPALPEYTEAPYELTADFEPVVILDVTQEFDNWKKNTHETLGVKVTLTGVDEDYLYVTVENLSGIRSRVNLLNLVVNGMQIDYYNEVEVGGRETVEDRMRLPCHGLKWLGYETVTDITIGDAYVCKASDTYGTDIQIHEKDVYTKVSDAKVRSDAPEGHTLWEGEEGRMVLLGIDYDDASYPRMMVLLENRQEDGTYPGLPNAVRPSYLSCELEVVEVNGEPLTKSGKVNMTVESKGLMVEDCILRPFEYEGLQRDLPVGEVREMKLHFSVTGDETELAGGELTLQPEAVGMPLWGNPYRWVEFGDIEVPEAWEEYYEKLMK